MELAKDDRYLDLVSVHYSGRNEIDDVSRRWKVFETYWSVLYTHKYMIYHVLFNQALDITRDAIQKAKQFHLFDSHNFYRNKNVFYQTHCYKWVTFFRTH